MTITKGRNTLFAIFLAGLTAQVIAVIVPYTADTIRHGEMLAVLSRLMIVYSVHFGVMLGGVFGRPQNTRARVASPAFIVAVVVTVVWNLLLAWRSIAFAAGAFNPASEDTADNVIAYLDSIADHSSFLVVGALAFFFAQEQRPASMPRRARGRSQDFANAEDGEVT